MVFKIKLLSYIIAFAGSGGNGTSPPLVNFLNNFNNDAETVAWGLFITAWIVGAVLRGSPIPFKWKKLGDDIISDAILGTFLIAAGATILGFIKSLGGQL